MTEQHDRRLIEDSLPLEAISYQSAREKSIRHGHISTLHIWWARRPLAAMRAAIFAALMPAPKDEEERVQMHRLIGGTYNAETGKWEGGICDWDSVKNGNDATIQQAQALIRKHYPDGPPKVLDPFMGGGSTGLEALRLGAEAHGVELNPVAHIIELCTLVYPQKYGQKITREQYEARPGTLPPAEHMAAYVDDEGDDDEDGDPEQQSFDFDTDEMVNPLAEDVERWGYLVYHRVLEELSNYYSLEQEKLAPINYHWVREVECPNPACRAQIPLTGNWWLAKRGSDRRITAKPLVDRSKKQVSFIIQENDEIDFTPDTGTLKRGSATCPVCGEAVDNKYLKEMGNAGRLTTRLIAVSARGSQSKKVYKAATQYDLNLYESTRAKLNNLLNQYPEMTPDETLPLMSGCFNIPIYGPNKWSEMYNDRQLLTMIVFSQEIQRVIPEIVSAGLSKEYADAVATYLTVVLDRLAVRMTSYCIWDSTTESVMQVFNQGQSLPMRWDHVEMNPIADEGSGWQTSLYYIDKVIRHCSVSADSSANLRQGTATRIPLESDFVDAVITDPPYYNAVPYADLSDFFYVWQRRTLGEVFPEIYRTPLSPKTPEITEMASWDSKRYSHKDTEFYENEMTKAFAESSRVLSDSGIFTIVFAHTSTTAWETLINSLLEANLVVTASWPLHTESRNRLRAQGSAALASSIFIVCRKRIAETDGIYDDVRPLMKNRIRERLNFFWSESIRGADFFISAIGPAVEVFGQYKTVRKLSGDVVTVAELLDIVQQEVADYALSQVMNGGAAFGPFDAATRFYIMYRWSYGKNKIEFDDGMRLAMALGAEVDALMHASSVLKKSGSSVTLLGPYDREKNEKLGEPARDRMAAPLIDMVHRSALLWRAGKREELARYVSTHVGTRVEALRAVAQALVNVLPDGDKEKQLYEGFLQGELPTAPTSTYMFDDDEFNQ